LVLTSMLMRINKYSLGAMLFTFGKGLLLRIGSLLILNFSFLAEKFDSCRR
jgi:hypothetical protein